MNEHGERITGEEYRLLRAEAEVARLKAENTKLLSEVEELRADLARVTGELKVARGVLVKLAAHTKWCVIPQYAGLVCPLEGEARALAAPEQEPRGSYCAPCSKTDRDHDWTVNNNAEGGIVCRRCGAKFTRADAHHAETGE